MIFQKIQMVPEILSIFYHFYPSLALLNVNQKLNVLTVQPILMYCAMNNSDIHTVMHAEYITGLKF